MGIVGPNGCGKFTILKLLAGQENLDTGAIHMKKGISAGLLAQIQSTSKDEIVYECLLSAFAKELQWKRQLSELEGRLSTEQDEIMAECLLKQYGDLQEQFEEAGGYELDSRVMKVATGLGLEPLLKKEFGATGRLPQAVEPRAIGLLGYMRDHKKQYVYEFYLRSSIIDFFIFSELDISRHLNQISKKNLDLGELFKALKVPYITVGPDGQWLTIVEY